MTRDGESQVDQESPARRLGVLYVASFFMIAVLTAVSQGFILRELSWQGGALSAVGRVARERSLDRPLSLSALAVVAADGSAQRGVLAASLRKAVEESLRDTPPEGRPAPDGTEPRSSPHERRAERHRLSARRSAVELLALLGPEGSAEPRADAAWPLARRVIAEEEAYGRAAAAAARAAEGEAVARIKRLKWFVLELLGIVMVVLLIEGLYVVKPAVRKIQTFVDDVARSNREMKVYAARLERSNKELQDFASVASHDLQEPLRKVQAFSDRLRSKCAGALDDQGLDYLDRIQNASKRMQTLINDLLTYARVSTTAQPFVPTDLTAITREVVSDLETRIEQAEGRVEVGDLPGIDADPLQVRQLMQNLIGNSLKYKRPDVPAVVKVTGRSLDDAPPGAAGAGAGPVCLIAVEDNGIGFDEVYTERIFTIFQRLHGRNEYEGTGVGLAVCRKIVERHGGTITARSTPGRGSTFLVTLPARQPTETTPHEREP